MGQARLPDETPIARCRNLGPKSAAMLAEIGLVTLGDLRATGAVHAFRRLRFETGRAASLNLLWAMQAALDGIRWQDVDMATKARLKAELGL